MTIRKLAAALSIVAASCGYSGPVCQPIPTGGPPPLPAQAPETGAEFLRVFASTDCQRDIQCGFLDVADEALCERHGGVCGFLDEGDGTLCQQRSPFSSVLIRDAFASPQNVRYDAAQAQACLDATAARACLEQPRYDASCARVFTPIAPAGAPCDGACAADLTCSSVGADGCGTCAPPPPPLPQTRPRSLADPDWCADP
jgi:hypothetical protein